MSHDPIPIANTNWALSAFGDADRCEIRLIVTLYIEREAPQLTQCITRGLQVAARRFGVDAMRQERCLCNPTTRFHPLPVHASERLAP